MPKSPMKMSQPAHAKPAERDAHLRSPRAVRGGLGFTASSCEDGGLFTVVCAELWLAGAQRGGCSPHLVSAMMPLFCENVVLGGEPVRRRGEKA